MLSMKINLASAIGLWVMVAISSHRYQLGPVNHLDPVVRLRDLNSVSNRIIVAKLRASHCDCCEWFCLRDFRAAHNRTERESHQNKGSKIHY